MPFLSTGGLSTTVIVRNFKITNSFPLNPFLRWRNITGPGLSSLIAIAAKTTIGDKIVIATAAAAISSARLTALSENIKGAWCNSDLWPSPRLGGQLPKNNLGLSAETKDARNRSCTLSRQNLVRSIPVINASRLARRRTKPAISVPPIRTVHENA